MTHTPGPWWTIKQESERGHDQNAGYVIAVEPGAGHGIAHVWGSLALDAYAKKAKVNATLMAAAPELLLALEELLQQELILQELRPTPRSIAHNRAVDAAHAAIAKALITSQPKRDR